MWKLIKLASPLLTIAVLCGCEGESFIEFTSDEYLVEITVEKNHYNFGVEPCPRCELTNHSRHEGRFSTSYHSNDVLPVTSSLQFKF